MEYHEFNWGSNDKETIRIISEEVFLQRVYEKMYKVRRGDVVVDIGANCGAFVYSLKGRGIAHAFCLEPSELLFPVLIENLKGMPCTFVNKGVAAKEEESRECIRGRDAVFENPSGRFRATRFMNFVREFKVGRVDLLKFDCEGGEFSLFDEDSKEYIKHNVRNLAGEYHITHFADSLRHFKLFRDYYLAPLRGTPRILVEERTGRVVTEEIFDDSYLENFNAWWSENAPDYGQLMIYAKLQEPTEGEAG